MSEILPSLRELRACFFCSMVKTMTQFMEDGCDNCTFLEFAGDKEKILDGTSSNFDGMIAMMDPNSSWVARWQRIDGRNYRRGMYAISVSGSPAEGMVEQYEQYRRYISRDRRERVKA